MAVLAANLSMLFNEYDFIDRFEAASKAGFSAVEYLFPYSYPADLLKGKLQKYNLVQALFNAPPGDWDAGERGIACIPGREEEFRKGIQQVIEYAGVLGNRRVHIMAGIKPQGISSEDARNCYISNLRYAAQTVAEYGLTVLIEPINNIDIPNYFVNLQEEGVELIKAIDEPNVKLQFDFYHCQMMQGNVVDTFTKLFAYIDHVQIAGVPGRHEPNVGELNYRYVLNVIDNIEFSGFIGCEYEPKETTAKGLSWMSV